MLHKEFNSYKDIINSKSFNKIIKTMY